ncbi:MFS transporter, ACS family, allantoate permease, partial [Tremellales sp. Uapishka_1]
MEYADDTKADAKTTVAYAEDIPAHGDGALALLHQQEKVNVDEIDPNVLKKLVRKIDMVLMPCMMLADFFQYLDKSSISSVSKKRMACTEFSLHGWGPYSTVDISSVSVMIRTPETPTEWSYRGTGGSAVFVWGAVLGLTAACHNFAGLATCRWILGMAEAAVSRMLASATTNLTFKQMVPLLGTITGMWYTRDEQATRVGFWFGSVGMAQVIGGAIAYGMYEYQGTVVKQWEFIFVVLGPITAIFGIVLAFVIPNSPATAWFLTSEEKVLAVERIRSNKTGTVATEYKTSQVWEAFKDPRIYLATLSVFAASVPNGGISSFGATIIKDLGYATRETTLLGMSTGVSETVAMIVGVLLSRRLKMRSVPAIICISIAVLGSILMIALPEHNKAGRFTGYCLIFWWAVGQMLFIPWMQSMIAGHTKRAGAQVYTPKSAPAYVPAKIIILVMLCLHAVTIGAIALLHKRWNAQKAAQEIAPEQEDIEFRE